MACLPWLIVAILLCARLHLLLVRVYDPDEFEHLHGGVCVARGQVPYRDFFEHHGPLTYYLTAPLALALGIQPGLLTANRLLSFGFLLATLWGTYRLTRCVFGRQAAPWSLAWLMSFPLFVEKSVEWRPDIPATCLVTWGFYFWLRRPRLGSNDSLLAGLSFGLAFLATPKFVFLLPGALGAMLVSQGVLAASYLSAGLLVGLAATQCVALAWFWHQGAAYDFVDKTLLLPLRWQMKEPFINFIIARPSWSPLHQGTLLFSLVTGVIQSLFPGGKRRRQSVLTWAILSHLAGAAIVPAAFLQYYLPAMPVAASLTVGMIAGSLGKQRHRKSQATWTSWVWCYRSGFVAISILMFAIGLLAWHERIGPTLTDLLESWEHRAVGLRDLYMAWDVLVAGFLALGLLLALVPPARFLALGILWGALAVTTAVRLTIPHFYWPNSDQRADMDLVERIVPEHGMVLDGFTGLGALRPHALYYWWLNHHSLPLVEKAAGFSGVVGAVETGKPALVIYDRELWSLRYLLAEPLARNYRKVAVSPQSKGILLLLRRDLPDPTAREIEVPSAPP